MNQLTKILNKELAPIIYFPIILFFLCLLFFTFSIFYKSDSSFDQDLGRHLKLGEIIFTTQNVPKTNLFSYTNPDFSFLNSHFLFEVFVYLWSLYLNLQSLLIFKIIIILISVSLILASIKKSNYPLLLPLGYLFLHVLRERTDLRPEIFSYLFLSLTFFILEKYYNNPKTKLIYLLPFIQLFWINTHIYFFLGLVLQAIYLFNFLLKKEFIKFKSLFIVFLISILVSLCNPNIFDGLIYPLKVFNNYGYTIAENQSIFLLENIRFKDDNFIFVKIISLIILFSIIISFLKNTWSYKNILIAFLGLIMALINIRSFPLLFYLCFPIVLQNFDAKKYSKKIIFLIIISAVLLFTESVLYLNGNYYKNDNSGDRAKLTLAENVKPAMEFVLSNNLSQPIYNNFDIGSYIIYRGYPKYDVFVDGRPEAYPASFFQNIYIPSQSDYEKFKKLDEKYNFQTIIFSITDQTPWGINFLKEVTHDNDWRIIFLDHFTIILVKHSIANQQKFSSVDLNNLSPDIYKFNDSIYYLRIAYFLSNSGFEIQAKKFIEKAYFLK